MKTDEPKLRKVLVTDLRRGDFFATIRQDYRELKRFMLTDERRTRIEKMGWLRRWLVLAWWLLKSLFLKLTPARRILLVLAVIWSFLHNTVTIGHENIQVRGNFNFGALILLFVLMLELKDKLLARGELEAGRAVQQALMPPRSPDVDGWKLWLFSRSANDVGGDLVDFIRVDEHRCVVVLGDVAGKGLRAALLTAKLQAILRTIAPDHPSAVEVVSKLNSSFHRVSLPNIFASLAYFELHPETGTIRMVNAGHLPPMLVRGASIDRMDRGDMAVGLAMTAAFSERQVDLLSGDVLCACSDGVTEARNGRGEFFSEERLQDELHLLAGRTLDAMGEGLVATVDRFRSGEKQIDDISIVLLQRA